MIDPSFGRLSDAPASFTLLGARVVDPAHGTDGVRDIAVRDGLVAAEPAPDAERIDARGLVVAPGFCDLHTHLREPGAETAETAESGARAAAKGGYTTVCAMPNTDPALDTPVAVRAAGRAALACRVRIVGAATVGRRGERPTDLDGLAEAGVVGVSDDGSSVDERAARAVVESLASLGLPLMEHAEDPVLAGTGVMRAGATATRLGIGGWPAEAELRIVTRDIELASAAGARLHLTHLSTAAALDAVREAKARGIGVTCDVTPHHLALHDGWVAGSRRFTWEEESDALLPLAFDGACRVNPPLTTREDSIALLEGVADGTIDAIATDHAPHPPERKLVPFEEAAPGVIGLETALSLGLAAVEAGRIGLVTLLSALSARPAAIIGEVRDLRPGAPADLVAFDPSARWRVERSTLASRSTNTPLLGMELPGVVRLTVADGRVTYRS